MDVSVPWELAVGTYYFKIWGNDGCESATTLTTSFQSTETKAATDIFLQLELSLGSSMKLKAVFTPTGSTSKVLWKSSKKTVCTVSKSGKVTAVGKGVCTITATVNGHKTKIRIKVVDQYGSTWQWVVPENKNDNSLMQDKGWNDRFQPLVRFKPVS